MRKNRFLPLAIALCLLNFILCSCTQVVKNNADELKMGEWHASLDNESEITLSFIDDLATLEVTNKDSESVCISGLSEVSDTDFVIHDNKTQMPFAFSYIVHFDRVEIIYEENTVSLYKS
ncbi:MAG: hypothetical protein IJ015_06065 [Ruminococcus sp.]|nr:hypothetical protein [Ruminococcus sp.]